MSSGRRKLEQKVPSSEPSEDENEIEIDDHRFNVRNASHSGVKKGCRHGKMRMVYTVPGVTDG